MVKWQYYHWHLEPSAVCAIQCPRCPRTEHPDTPWLNKNMDLKFVKKFFTPDMLKKDVKRITMCGDVGDPIYCPQYLDIYEYIKSVDPTIHIFTITNGSHKKTSWWKGFAELANEYDAVNFSIDGYDNDSNNIYRVNSKWDTIIDGIKTLRQNNSKVFLNWATIIFRFNQDKLNDIQKIAKSLEMDSLQITKSTKFGSKYGQAYGADQDALEPDAEYISSSHRYERYTINLSGRSIDNADYLNYNKQMYEKIAVEYADKTIIPLCEVGNRGIYVNAEGVVFPCSWVSFPYHSLSDGKKTIQWKDSFFSQHRDKMNLKNRSFNEIITDPLWNKLSNGWSDNSKTWVECSLKCNNCIVNKEYAVGWETN